MMNRFDALSRLKDEVQATEECLCEISEPTSEWAKVEAATGSARGRCYGPMLNVKMKQTTRSTEERHNVRANSTVIKHDGARRCEAHGHPNNVERVLISAETLTQAGNEVNLSSNMPHIKHALGEVTPLQGRGRVFVCLFFEHVVQEASP